MNHINLPPDRRLKVAVIGTGIAGMSAAWLLDQGHDVTVYEKNGWVGGHSNTVDAPTKEGDILVDTGFIVYNEIIYPNLSALFKHLGVATRQSEMSFAASLDNGAMEYSGTSLNGLFGQRLNAARRRFWSMIADLLRFYREAPLYLDDPDSEMITLGEYLDREHYGKNFVNDHILPMGAAIWSTTAKEMRDYPARAFIRFFDHHGLLRLKDRPQWRTVAGGSREYVSRLTAPWRDRIRFSDVRAVQRRDNDVLVEDLHGRQDIHDHVVIATHADEALHLLADPDSLEQRLLGSWRYTRNRAVLHKDQSLMPLRKRVWSSWNFLDKGEGARGKALCVTYWMNRLQSLGPGSPFFVTLNPSWEPAADTIYREFEYTHPYFDGTALSTHGELWSLQGRRRTWYCGSYFGYGFHEDALQAGLAVAEQLGRIRRPWRVEDESGRIGLPGKIQEVAA